jgi:hypothetical protein
MSTSTLLPSFLISYLERKTIKKPTYSPIKDRYSITDIIGCRRKNYYNSLEVEKEELLNDTTVENMWDSVRGDLLHQITYAYKWREMDIDHNVILNDGRVAQ